MCCYMKKILSAPQFGVLILEDLTSGLLYFQCLCGQMAMYDQCVQMNQEESDDFRANKLDISGMVYDICKETTSFKPRLVTPTPPQDIVGYGKPTSPKV